MQEVCDLKVHVNGHHTFFLHQRIICKFSGKLRRVMKQERRGVKWRPNGTGIQIKEFPGGAHGFEMVARFCYNSGRIAISPSNVCLLHCAAILLEMSEEVADCNLLTQTEAFLEGLFRWTWSETVAAVRSCELLLLPPAAADSVLELLISGLLEKISSISEIPSSLNSSSSSSSSCSSPGAARKWWFDDLAALAPSTVERIAKALGANSRGGGRGGNLTLTRFLLHYLESSRARPGGGEERYCGLADAAVQGVLAAGRAGFSCRGLFGVMRAVARLGVSAEARRRLESMVGEVVDHATLDDLLVSGEAGGAAYDVNLVVRLVRTFVGGSTTTGFEEEEAIWLQRLKKVGRLVDKYLAEISPDSSLKVSKFLEVAESLPDSARDCFDGVYRALDIYLESHPALSIEERTRLCGCLNYEKLTLEACKDLAKNRRIPPGVAVQALVSQQGKIHTSASPKAAAVDEEEELRLTLQRMQCRVRELEKMCRSMKGRMSRMEEKKSRSISQGRKGMPRLC